MFQAAERPSCLYNMVVRSAMAIKTTYSHARAHLAHYWDEATRNRETVVIERRGAEDVALIAASELAGLVETAHLLGSPRNAARLRKAFGRAKARKSKPSAVGNLLRDLGIDEKE